MKTSLIVFPFDLFGSSGAGAGAALIGDEFREILADNRRETVPTRARAYTEHVRLREFTFENLEDYADWRKKGRQAVRQALRAGDFLVWVAGNHLGALPVYDELAAQADGVLVVQFDAHLDIHHFRDTTTELSHGNFLLHCAGPLPRLVNVGHRELLLPADHVSRTYHETFPAADLAVDPAPAVERLRAPLRTRGASLSTWIATCSTRRTSLPCRSRSRSAWRRRCFYDFSTPFGRRRWPACSCPSSIPPATATTVGWPCWSGCWSFCCCGGMNKASGERGAPRSPLRLVPFAPRRYHSSFMKPHEPPPNAVLPRGPGDHPLWWGAFLALLAAQTWMTLGLFGPGHAANRLFDDQPILSGRHPLHLYHGLLGARSFLNRGTLSCYDPAFQAGYPKTPVFDDGSRPAEMLLALAGGAICRGSTSWAWRGCVCWRRASSPGRRGAGLNRFRACLACGLGMLVWWGRPCRELLEAGDVGLLLAALAVLAQTGLLLRYHRAPGPLSAIGVALTAFLGWFASPILMVLSAPLFLLYYFTAGPRHPLLWHVSLACGLAGAVLANLFWLLDWVNYWWIHTPLNLEAPALTAHTLRALWEAPMWGESADRTLACFLAAAALGGVVLMHRGGYRPAARLFGLGMIGWLLLAGTAVVWGPLARAGGDRLFVPALLFAAAPAAHALTTALRPVRRWGGWGTAALAGGGGAGRRHPGAAVAPRRLARPLAH